MRVGADERLGYLLRLAGEVIDTGERSCQPLEPTGRSRIVSVPGVRRSAVLGVFGAMPFALGHW